ncbi:ABC transporter ATP-binding protein [Pelagibius sp.]|uniref:ABC transporter ATP-binding protein n=1 Tax=Pelagibius sp. TaxID=1931238 RepID=UPI002603765C|nr:ABC transporter ATP-binding protein [Pelagibius sp.]
MLEVRGIEAAYGSSQALFGVNVAVGEGQMVALLGRNGMGKTTTIRTLCGLMPARAGTLRFLGEDIGGLPAYRIARRGIGLVPEGRRCFPNLTVRENLLATARGEGWDRAAVARLFPRLEERAEQMARTLSGGEQQMLAIGRALMTNPRLLILDEATEGLAPVIRHEIWAAIAAVKARGQAILIVDKNLKDLLPLSDACVILEKGRSVWRGNPDDLAADADLQDRYLGL